MRVNVFNGSPQLESHTKAAIELFLKGMYSKADELKGKDPSLFTNTFNLHWMNIQNCKHCDMCNGNGGRCIIQDDFQNIGARLASCDVLVFATPLCWFGMSAQLKKAIDRMRAAEKSAMKGKKVFLLVTTDTEPAFGEGYRLLEKQINLICDNLEMELIAAHCIRATPEENLKDDPEQVEIISNLYKKLL